MRPGSRSAKSRTSSAVEKQLDGVVLFSIRRCITLHRVAAHRRVHVELGVEQPADLVEIEQRLAEERQFRRHPQTVLRRRLRAISSIMRPTFSSFAAVCRCRPAMSTIDAAHLQFVEVVAPLAEGDDGRCRLVAAPIRNRQHQPEQPLLQRRRQATDHPEIDQRRDGGPA